MKMKNLFIILIGISLSSCLTYKEKIRVDVYDLSSILMICKGGAVVIATGENGGNYEDLKYYILIKDFENNTYEYLGAKYDIQKGDTLINKQ